MKILKSTSFSIPIIGVGNLSVGGTGKSPMIIYLANLLSSQLRIGVLSRGYGRKTRGYKVLNYKSNYKTVGDEAMQLFQRFKNRFVIAVSENRVSGAKKLIKEMDLDVLLLDDSHQHRAIKPGFNILLTDYQNPYFKDFILPAGNLRESRSGAKRADIIIVTKCPEHLTQKQKNMYISQINPQRNQQVFFSSISYDHKIYSENKAIPIKNLGYYKIVLVTGIANASQFINKISKYTKKIQHLEYRDHHPFSIEDVRKITEEYQKLNENKLILTTEKDFVRLKGSDYFKEKLFYWRIHTKIDRKSDFNQIIFDYVKQN